jgi:gliding motility-associated lipoprotein GldH
LTNPLFNRQNLKIILLSGLFLIFVTGFSSCDPKRVFEKNITVATSGWKSTQPIEMDVDIQDTVSLTNFYINVRHTTGYKYSNIYFFVDTFFPEGSKTRDTLQVILADDAGKWFGKGLGNVKSAQVLIKSGVTFPVKGIYKFRIEQGMRDFELKGIEDVGIRIEKM